MDILCRPAFQLHFGQRLKRSRQVSSRQGKLKLSQTVQTPARYHYPPKHTRRRASGSRNKVSQSLSRNVMFFVGFVTMHKTLGHATVRAIMYVDFNGFGGRYAKTRGYESIN